MKQISIIGAGAAGMTAAFFALKNGADVTLYEKNRQAGRKLCITGKGRCNLTNASDTRDFLAKIVQGSKFLYSALYRFGPEETMEWFESLGVRLKVERGNRVFPESDRAQEVRDVLFGTLNSFENFRFLSGAVTALSAETDGGWLVETRDGVRSCDSVILATGGASYPLTGSTGDGYRLARRLGHEVTPIAPSLVRIRCEEACCSKLQGLSLKNVRLTLLRQDGKTLFSDQGELLFTEDGISGPLALSASVFLRNSGKYRIEINFKPALSAEELDRRILRDFSHELNRLFRNSLDQLLPASVRPVFVERSAIDPAKPVHQITREERARLLDLFQHFSLTVLGPGPLEEAIVTAGGIELSAVDPHTMQSRICPELYFAGEILDCDGVTGGYNLQIAFSTGRLAGESAAQGRRCKNLQNYLTD